MWDSWYWGTTTWNGGGVLHVWGGVEWGGAHPIKKKLQELRWGVETGMGHLRVPLRGFRAGESILWRFCWLVAGCATAAAQFSVSGGSGKLEGVPLDGGCPRHLYLYNYFILRRKLSPSTITIFYLPISPGRGLFHGAWTLLQKTLTRNALIAVPSTLFCQFLFRAGSSPQKSPFYLFQEPPQQLVEPARAENLDLLIAGYAVSFLYQCSLNRSVFPCEGENPHMERRRKRLSCYPTWF